MFYLEPNTEEGLIYLPVRIPKPIRIGSVAETEIKAMLQSFSIPMKPEPDVEGVDFYCKLEDGTIFLVQAKGAERFGEKWTGYFDRKTIISWLNQLTPVFLIVYDLEKETYYWKSVHKNRNDLIEKLNSPRKWVSITINKSEMLSREEFAKQVKADSQSMEYTYDLFRGFPRFIGNGYVKKIPILVLPDWLIHNLGVNIRLTLYTLANHYLLLGNNKAKAYFLCKFLTDFDKSHYDHFRLMGQICLALERKEEAISYYNQAIEICRRDTNWNKRKRPSDPSIEDIIISIKKEMKGLF